MRKATSIIWETDGLPVRLPTEMLIPDEVEEGDVADFVSDQIGWLVSSFEITDVIHA